MDDRQIIEALIQGGHQAEKALEALNSKYNSLRNREQLPCTLRNQQVQNQVQEEAWQDTLQAFWKNARQGKIDGTTPLRPYIKTIYKRKLIDYCRKYTSKEEGGQQNDTGLENAQHKHADESSHPEDLIRKRALLELMQRALTVLGDPCKSLLLLDMQGFKNEEIAAQLDFKNKAVVASKKKQCHYRLREILEKWGIDPNDYLA